MRTELLDERDRVHGELVECLGVQRLDPQPLLGAGHLVPMDRVGELAQLVLVHGDLTAHGHQRGVTEVSSLFRGLALAFGPLGGLAHPTCAVLRTDAHRGCDLRLPAPAFATDGLTLTRGELGRCRSLEGIGTFVQRPCPLLLGAQHEPGLGLPCARLAGQRFALVAQLGRRLALIGVVGARRLKSCRQRGVGSPVDLESGLHRGHGLVGAVGLRMRRPDDGPELTELLGHRRHARVGVVQPLQRLVNACGGCGDPFPQPGRLEASLLHATARVGSALARLVQRPLDLDEAGRARAAPAHGARSEDIPCHGHGGEVGMPGQHREGGVVVGHEHHAAQEPVQRRREVGRALEDVAHPAGPVRQRRSPRRRCHRLAADKHPGLSCLTHPQGRQPADGRLERVKDNGIRGPPQGGRDRGLAPVRHRDQLRQGAHDAMVAVSREQRGGTVLAGQAQGERLRLGGRGLTVPVGDPLLLQDALQLGPGVVQLPDGCLVVRIESLLAFLVHGDGGLQGGKLPLGRGGALQGLGASRSQPSDLGLCGVHPGRFGEDLSGEGGDTLATVRGGPGQLGKALLLHGIPPLGGRPLGHRLVEPGSGPAHLRQQLAVLGSQLARLGAHELRVARREQAGLGLVRAAGLLLGEQPHSLCCESCCGREAFDEAGQREPAPLGLAAARADPVLPRPPGWRGACRAAEGRLRPRCAGRPTPSRRRSPAPARRSARRGRRP